MTQSEEQLISIINKAKACIECEEDIKIDDEVVEKIFYEKLGSSNRDGIIDTSFVKRKEFTYGNI